MLKDLDEELHNELIDHLQDFFKVCDVEDVSYLIVINRGRENRFLANSCLRCHEETLQEMIKTQKVKHIEEIT